jgi:polyhydroxyalkanoate synthesis repressor PhaR
MLVKKYGNRRLYDTESSRYVTLEELAEKIRAGADARVVDAKTHADLTQATLTQIILESRGAGRLLPVPLLTQLIRLGDDALGEFFGRYVQWALEIYLQTRQVALGPLNPLAALAQQLPGMASPFARIIGIPPPQAPPTAQPPPSSDVRSEVAELRKKLEALEQRDARSLRRRVVRRK